MLVESYATLINRKLVIPSQKTNYIAVDRGYWLASFSIHIAEIELDETWYLSNYPDVRDAIKSGVIDTAMQHYCESGYFEHRMPYEIIVDSTWYNEVYVDVKQAIENGTFSSAQAHFEEIGFKEGRLPYPNFSFRARAAKSVA